MKVLLCEDVENLGWYGDIVEVSEGYARNYLLPRRLATIPTEQKIKAMAEEKARRAEQRRIEQERLQKAADAVNGIEVVIPAKVNEQGHLFGSVTGRQIVEAIKQKGIEVDEKVVHFDTHIKELGQHTVRLKFSGNVIAKIKVTVVAEGQVAQTDGAEEQKAVQ